MDHISLAESRKLKRMNWNWWVGSDGYKENRNKKRGQEERTRQKGRQGKPALAMT